ncbi:MAG: NYN domain-containing protein [Elusimicrobia bacterium]|nr:NYN domain-containing protein [Elusimicrobiota bacterium]
MAKTVLVDGSNAVHALFGPLPASHAEQDGIARHFLSALSEWVKRQPPAVAAEVVFDGSFRQLRSPGADERLRLFFSDHASADAVILERIRAHRFNGRSVTVVTWDRALAQAAVAEEARAIGPDQLWKWIKK